MALRVERTPGMAAATVAPLFLRMAVAAREGTRVPVARVAGLLPALPVLAGVVVVVTHFPANMLSAAAAFTFTARGLTVRQEVAAALAVPMAALELLFPVVVVAVTLVMVVSVGHTAEVVVTHSPLVVLEP
jgi:hypothetical protein